MSPPLATPLVVTIARRHLQPFIAVTKLGGVELRGRTGGGAGFLVSDRGQVPRVFLSLQYALKGKHFQLLTCLNLV